MAVFELLATGEGRPKAFLSLFLAFASLSAVYFISITIYSAFFGPLSRFPGPKLWAISVIPRIMVMVSGNEATEFARLHETYGPVVRVGPFELSYASPRGQAWKDLYGFKKQGQSYPQKDPRFNNTPLNGVDGVLTADDVNHGRQRKILSHSFSDKALKEQEPLLKKWALKMKTKMSEHDATTKTDLVKFYNCTTFDIMGDLTFSEGLNMLDDGEYSPWVKNIFASIKIGTTFRGIRYFSSITRHVLKEIVFKSKKARQRQWEHWNYSAERVDRRLQREPEHTDLWSKILAKDVEDGGLTKQELYSNASGFMIAGTETTAAALSGTSYYLLKNPQYLQKLVDEVRGAFTSFDDINLENLARLKYLDAVLHEGLRMYPPVPIGLLRRTPPEGMTICGAWVPGGILVGVSHFSTYRASDNFKNSYEFHPERWLGDAEYKDDHLDAVEPFMVGPRNCIGKNLAWNEMRLLLVTVLLHFDLKLCAESSNWKDQKVYTIWEKAPLWCNVKAASS